MAVISPISFMLKDGRSAVLRTACNTDAAQLLCFIKTVAAETDFLLRAPDELDFTVEQEYAFIKDKNEGPGIMLLCIVDGVIAGNCSLEVTDIAKLRHRGTVGISILQKYGNLGIGTAMLNALAAFGKSKNLHHLDLTYIQGNDKAAALYKKMGYVTVATVPYSFMQKDGNLRDEIFMQLVL